MGCKTRKSSGNSLKSRQLNNPLDDIRTSLKSHYHKIETHEAYVSTEKVQSAFLGYSTKQSTLLELFKTHNEDIQKLVGISKTEATLSKYDRAYRRLGEFMQAKSKITDIVLKEINYKFVTELETYVQ